MKPFLTLLFAIGMHLSLFAQLIYTSPAFPTATDEVTIYYDATQGTAGLATCNCDIYIHTGVITNLSAGLTDWKYVQTSWGQANDAWKLTPVVGSPNLYSFTITGSITDYYNVPAGETVEKIAMVFRNATGSLEGKDNGGGDIYADVYAPDAGYLTKFVTPTAPASLKQLGDQMHIIVAANMPSDIAVFDNGVEIFALTDVLEWEHTYTITEGGSHTISYTASNGMDPEQAGSFVYIVPQADLIEALPGPTKLGATYFESTGTVRLKLQAPGKQYAYMVGDYSGWIPQTTTQMKKTPDGEYFWIELSATAGQPFRYQYLLEGGLIIADPLSEVVLTSADDSGIPESTYPNLPAYPTNQATGNVTLFRPGYPQYEWQTTDFVKPDKHNLIIYELLIRDFDNAQSFQVVKDSLDYLQKLGVNAIQLMPIQEFEGNLSWGYNPSFHMAIDKFYGSTDSLKALVDECHSRGIAVIADVVFNHAFGQSPLVRMYWDSALNKPATNNPWANPDATHPFNVGYDLNHESQATKDYMYRCLQFWINEYKIDGFRFDLSKGFTQTNYGQDVGAWGGYDAGRVAILEQLADTIWATDPTNYVILEHLGGNQEETVLANYGMMPWGKLTSEYTNAAESTGNVNLSWISYKQRGWAEPNLVGFMESHDEERVMRELTISTSKLNDYVIKDTTTALERMELAHTFLLMVPGPKMFWQFGELGYEFCINRCKSSGACNNCRLDEKPIRWDYLQDARRVKLYDVVRSLNGLKTTYPETFNSTDFAISLSNNFKTIRLNNADMNAVVMGNFGLSDANINPMFQHTGKWYEYFSGDSIEVSNVTATLPMLRGEYRIYTDVQLPAPPMGYIEYSINVDDFTPYVFGDMPLSVFPNPSGDEANVRFNITQATTVQIELLDLLGRSIQSEMIDAPQGVVDYRLKGLQTGTYVVRVQSGTQSAAVVLRVQ